MGAAGFAAIQQAAGHIGVVYFTRVGVFQFQDTALATPVAQRFPFGRTHLAEAFFFPEGAF